MAALTRLIDNRDPPASRCCAPGNTAATECSYGSAGGGADQGDCDYGGEVATSIDPLQVLVCSGGTVAGSGSWAADFSLCLPWLSDGQSST
jgi:hypothetical protein